MNRQANAFSPLEPNKFLSADIVTVWCAITFLTFYSSIFWKIIGTHLLTDTEMLENRTNSRRTFRFES